MSRKIRKAISISFISAMVLAAVNLNVSAAGFKWPTVYDMTQNSFSFDNIANKCTEEGHINVGYFADPEDAGNTVIGIRKCASTGKYADMRAVMNYTESAVMYETDIYRTSMNGDFEIKMFANTGGASGNNVSLFKMDTSGNVYAGSKKVSSYMANTWYRIRIKSNREKTYHEIYIKTKDDDNYTYLGYAGNKELGFTSDLYIHYYMNNKSDSFTYFDNMSWTLLDNDLNKKVRYDFNDVSSVSGKYMELAINSNNMEWSSVSFGGETTLKAKMNETADMEVYNWEDIPDMERVYVEASMGFDSGTDEKVNLPFQFGIRPVFAQADGTKGAESRNNMSDGIRYAYSRHILLEGVTLAKAEGASISNNILYKSGYVYDREKSIFKAYFIAGNGKTFVCDASENQYVRDKRYLAGIKLYQRSKGDYKTGAGYYDYLYIDEADSMSVESVSPSNNETEVSLNPEIKAEFNYVIDPDCIGNVSLKDSVGNEIDINAEIYGKSIIITPVNKLNGSKAYTVEISGIKDLLGQESEPFTSSFMTGSAVKMESVMINGGDTLINGNNNIVCSLSSNDGDNHNVTVMAMAFDENTNELLSWKAVRGSVGNDKSYSVGLDFDTSGFSDYDVDIYVWSGLGTMKPYSKVKTFSTN